MVMNPDTAKQAKKVVFNGGTFTLESADRPMRGKHLYQEIHQMKYRLLGLFVGGLLTSGVYAGGGAINPILDDTFTFRLGASYLDLDGKFSSTLKGQSMDKLETDALDLDDADTQPYFGARWRFTDRWRLTFDYLGLDTEGRVQRDFDRLIFGTIDVSGFLAVETSLKTDFYITQIGYSFLKNERAELGIGAGLHVVNLDTSLKVSAAVNNASGSVQSDTADWTAPLPDIIGFGTYAFTPKLSIEGGIAWFGLNYDDYSGDLVSASAAVEYRLTDHWGVGLGYTYIDMDLDVERSSREDNYNLEYQGPVLYVSAGF